MFVARNGVPSWKRNCAQRPQVPQRCEATLLVSCDLILGRAVLLTIKVMVAKICDFGIARQLDHATEGTIVDTFQWMAPEVYIYVMIYVTDL